MVCCSLGSGGECGDHGGDVPRGRAAAPADHVDAHARAAGGRGAAIARARRRRRMRRRGGGAARRWTGRPAAARPGGRSAISVMIASISSGPRPQFPPAPAIPRSAIRLYGGGRADAHHRVQIGVEAHGRDDLQIGRHSLRSGDRGLDLGHVAHRLDQEEVGPALGQPRGLLGEDVGGLVSSRAVRAGRSARRSARCFRRPARPG